MDIRIAGVKDLPLAGQILYLSMLDTYPHFLPTFSAAAISIESRISIIEEWFKKQDSPRCLLLAYDGDRPVGYSTCCHKKFREFQAELPSFHVLPDSRGSGIGTQLFQRTVSWLLQSGVNSMYLEAYRANPFICFYEKRGGKVVSTFLQKAYGSEMEVVVYGWDDLHKLMAAMP